MAHIRAAFRRGANGDNARQRTIFHQQSDALKRVISLRQRIHAPLHNGGAALGFGTSALKRACNVLGVLHSNRHGDEGHTSPCPRIRSIKTTLCTRGVRKSGRLMVCVRRGMLRVYEEP